jgi:putative transposase
MARPLRIEFPGAVYHVTSRGDRREPIFDDDQDRHAFLNVIAQATERFDAEILAYCLMDNHYHLVIHTRRGNLSRLMQQLNGVYTQAYNRRHSKVGHLFQGRFKGILVDENAYLLEVCRYVDLNPVRARVVRDPGNWRWSSYRAHTGSAIPPAWLDTPAVHGYLLGRDAGTEADRRKAGSRYAGLVAAGKGVKLWDEALAHQIYLGGPEFVERMQALIEKYTGNAKDIPRLQRRAVAKPIDYYLKRNKDRDAGICEAVMKGQHSMTDVGKALGLTVSRVSRIVKARSENKARGKA